MSLMLSTSSGVSESLSMRRSSSSSRSSWNRQRSIRSSHLAAPRVLLLLLEVVDRLELRLVVVLLRSAIVSSAAHPFAHAVALLLLWVLLGRLAQALLGKGLGLKLLLAHLEALHLRLDQLPRVRQRPLVLDVRVGDPCLDIVTIPLQLLDLRLELRLELLLLVLVLRAIDLFPDLVEDLHALLHLF